MQKITRFVEGMVATTLVALVLAPAAFAAGEESAKATASANASVVKTLVKLKKQVGALKRQVAALEGQNGGPRTPSGPAGGDLTGSYPNPAIGPNAVGVNEIQDNAVTTGKLADNAVIGSKVLDGSIAGPDVADGSLTGFDIVDASIGGGDLLFDTVGARELKGLTAHVGNPVTVSKDNPAETAITCPAGTMLIAGGHAWLEDEENSIIASAPSETDPTHTWVVRGMVPAGSNSLFPWATCLAQ